MGNASAQGDARDERDGDAPPEPRAAPFVPLLAGDLALMQHDSELLRRLSDIGVSQANAIKRTKEHWLKVLDPLPKLTPMPATEPTHDSDDVMGELPLEIERLMGELKECVTATARLKATNEQFIGRDRFQVATHTSMVEDIKHQVLNASRLKTKIRHRMETFVSSTSARRSKQSRLRRCNAIGSETDRTWRRIDKIVNDQIVSLHRKCADLGIDVPEVASLLS